jgi:hypothetical protein
MDNEIQITELYDLWYDSLLKHPYTIVLIAFLCLFIFILLSKLYRRFKQKNIKQDPWQEALTALQAIDLSLFQDPDMHKQFYYHLTGIMKQYLAARYALPLESKTDQEVLAELRASGFPKDLVNYLEPILQGAVLIKFSNNQAIYEKMRYDLMYSIDIVRNSIPQTK